MRVSVLVILYHGEDHITIHDDDDGAWTELVEFVGNRWDFSPERAATSEPVSDDERVRIFFASPDASYILGNADVSELEVHVGSLVPD